MNVDPRPKPNSYVNPSPDPTNEPDNDTGNKTYIPTTSRRLWTRTWPSLLAVVTLTTVGGPAAVASYRHAGDVITQHGDPVMAPWLALTTDGMLLAALTVIWVRRHRNQPVQTGPWAAFWAGMTATIAANLAAANPTPIGIVVALWPPICLAITLELVALVAYPTQKHPIATDTQRGKPTGHTPDHVHTVPEQVPAEPAVKIGHVPAAGSAGTNGHLSRFDCAAAGQFQQAALSPVGQPPAPELRHNDQPSSGGVPDNHILAWLRERERNTGQVPGRRQTIEQWALGSTRADRLRAIVIKEAASTATTPAS